jgi:hypothetical protein
MPRRKVKTRAEQVEAARRSYAAWWSFVSGVVEQPHRQAYMIKQSASDASDPMSEVVDAGAINTVHLELLDLSSELPLAAPIFPIPNPFDGVPIGTQKGGGKC